MWSIDLDSRFEQRHKPKALKERKKKGTYESISPFYESRGMVLNAFKSGIFSITI